MESARAISQAPTIFIEMTPSSACNAGLILQRSSCDRRGAVIAESACEISPRELVRLFNSEMSAVNSCFIGFALAELHATNTTSKHRIQYACSHSSLSRYVDRLELRHDSKWPSVLTARTR